MTYATAPLAPNPSTRATTQVRWLSGAGRVTGQVVALFGADCLAVLTANSAVSRWPLRVPGALGAQATVPVHPLDSRILVALSAVTFYLILRGRYTNRLRMRGELQSVLQASLYAITVELMLGIGANNIAGRLPDLSALSILPVCLAAARVMTERALMFLGLWHRPVLLIGDEAGIAAAEAGLLSDSGFAYQVVGRVNPSARGTKPERPAIQPMLDQCGAGHLMVAMDGNATLDRDLLAAALRAGCPYVIAVQIPHGCPRSIKGFVGNDRLALRPHAAWSPLAARLAKTAIDVTVAATLFVGLAPLLLLISLLVRLDGGPALFTHRRIGFRGRHFGCLKFRTMVVGAEHALQNVLSDDPALGAEWTATQKLRHDPRITRLGAFLRRTSLDELPQLINVLKRDMSLVGPRPIVDSEIRHYGENIAHYYAVRPGMTGLWQISGRSNTTFETRVRLDVRYATSWSISTDIAVLLKTIPVALRGEGAH